VILSIFLGPWPILGGKFSIFDISNELACANRFPNELNTCFLQFELDSELFGGLYQLDPKVVRFGCPEL
jgi:hypothetical protein